VVDRISVEASRQQAGLAEQHSIGCELRVTADRTPAEREWSFGSLLQGPGLDVYPDPDKTRILWQELASVAPFALSRQAPTLRSG
jgi:hypothetical protein